MFLKFDHYNLFILLFFLFMLLIILYFYLNSNNNSKSHSQSSFPNRYPLFGGGGGNAENGKQICVNQVRLDNGTIYNEMKLKTCSTDSDCSNCQEDVSCQTVSETVANDQKKTYGNNGNKFCMPKLKNCLIPPTFESCINDRDCMNCDTSDIGNGRSFQCETVGSKKTVKFNIENNKYEYTNDSDKDKNICLPKRQYCANGTSTWTKTGDTQEWACECDYPNIYGGKNCDVMIACSNHLTNPSTKNKQLLLINNSPIKSDIGTPWNKNKNLDPTASSCKENPSISCKKNSSGCTCIPNTICQCDGIHGGENYTYKNDPTNKLKCMKDPCFFNALGGRSKDDNCICSGPGTSLWKYNAINGYSWSGHCEDKKLGNIIIPGDKTKCLYGNETPNMNPKETRLVPSTSGGQNFCVKDPCGGQDNVGYYNPLSKKCVCSPGFIDTDLKASNISFNPYLNPIGRTCLREPCLIFGTLCNGGQCKNLNDGKGGWQCYNCPTGTKLMPDGKTCGRCGNTSNNDRCNNNNDCCDNYTCSSNTDGTKSCKSCLKEADQCGGIHALKGSCCPGLSCTNILYGGICKKD